MTKNRLEKKADLAMGQVKGALTRRFLIRLVFGLFTIALLITSLVLPYEL